MEFIDMIKRSAMKLGRGLKHVKTHKDGHQTDEEGESKKITVGICVLEKKALSPPMTQILDRLKAFGEFEIIMFGDDVILNQPIEKWPVVECLIAFYSQGYPLEKVIKYAKLRKPFLVNELESQYLLHDRRKVYSKLEEYGIAVPNYIVVNRDQPNQDVDAFVEDEDWIELNGKRVHKPFVEKPVDGDDHSVMIYYPSTAGGGMKELFRKVGNRASEFHPEIRRVRRDGSYLYEEFMPTGGTDVKVYTVGPDYAHAEARKSPVVDGVVQRSKDGKEVRFPVLLSPEEKSIAHDVCTMFGQAVCGFDLLRSNGRSYVCDVNGWSFVKNSYKYYDDAACVLRCMFIAAAAPFQDISLPPTLPWKSKGNASPTIERHGSYGPSTFGRTEELRCVIAVIRHGDRTPKQKVKLKIHSERLLNLMLKYNGGRPREEAKLKSAVQLQDLLDACRQLIPRMRTGRESDSEAEDIEHAEKLRHVKAVLEEGGHFSGIYRKVQLKPLQWVKEANEKGEEIEKVTEALLILKYGGVLTHAGRQQAESLGKDFRNNMYPGEGTGLLRLHSTYRHDLKIYTSDEGRVQMSAAAFTKGLLDLEGQLTPILVSLVSRDAAMLDIVDPGADQMMETSKKFLFEAYSNNRGPETPEDSEKPWMVDGGGIPVNPLRLLQRLVELTKLITAQLKELCKEEDYAAGSTSGSEDAACYVSLEARALGKADLDQDRVEAGLPCGSENFLLMFARWKKLERDMYNERKNKYDISKIPDIYDCAKYDLLHNPHLNLVGLDEIFAVAKALADGVIPNEYGINPVHKLRIGSKICRRLVGKILIDFQNTQEETLSVAKLTSEPSGHWKPTGKSPWRPFPSSTAKLSSLGNSEVSSARAGVLESTASVASVAASEASSAPGGGPPGTLAPADVTGEALPGSLPLVRVSGGGPPGTLPPVEVTGGVLPGTPRSSTPSIMVGESAAGPPSEAELVAMQLGRLEVSDNRRVSERVNDRVSDRSVEKLDEEPDSPSGKSDSRGEDSSYRLNPKYANVKTPQRHVRTRLYFTSESHIHSLINVLRYCHLDDKLAGQEPLISDEALQRVYETRELDYLTHIVLRLYENTEVPINEPKRFRVDLQYSSGAALSPLEVTPRGRDHVLPILPREPLQNVGTYLSLEQLEVMLKPFAMPVEEFPPPAGYPAVRHEAGDSHHRHRNPRSSNTGYMLQKIAV